MRFGLGRLLGDVVTLKGEEELEGNKRKQLCESVIWFVQADCSGFVAGGDFAKSPFATMFSELTGFHQHCCGVR